MLSRTSEYALRALICMARQDAGRTVSCKRIAALTDIPPKYLSKVLGDLVRVGVLASSRGKSGGFRMARRPQETRLLEVLVPFEQFGRRCPFGQERCSDEDPCLAHDQWKRVLEAQHRFLSRTSVYDIAVKKRDRSRTNSGKRIRP